jgi:hypothetical protein
MQDIASEKVFAAFNTYGTGYDFEVNVPDPFKRRNRIQKILTMNPDPHSVHLYCKYVVVSVNIYILFTRGLAELDCLIEKINIRGFCFFFITSLHLTPFNGFSSMS